MITLIVIFYIFEFFRIMGDRRVPDRMLEHLRQIEEAAEEVLSEKQEIVDLDRKRNHNREAIRALSRSSQENTAVNEEKQKCWLAMGNCFFQLPQKKAQTLLQQDQTRLDCEINKLRSDIKVKVNNLRDKEGKSELKSFNLKGMNQEDMSVFSTK